jgi:D-serine deaminase-like pyridoxal phosphate-dependent protein
MLKRVGAMNSKFRAHIKTHKSIEGVRRQLGYDLADYDGKKYDSIVVSTLREAWGVVQYQEQNSDVFVKDIIYGFPNITPESLAQIAELQQKVETFSVLLDSVDQLKIIEEFFQGRDCKPMRVIVKLDTGTNRAGILDLEYLSRLLNVIASSQFAELHGFYVHSGHSYDSNTIEESEESLIEELETVKKGIDILEKIVPSIDLSKLIVSVGATPTLHSLQHHVFEKNNQRIIEIQRQLKCQLEFHAGNYIFCDLQQVATGCIDIFNVAVSVIGSVISQYPQRNHAVGELLTNTGTICMSKELSRKFPGFGSIQTEGDYGKWYLDRMSQEHGILKPLTNEAQLIPIGTKYRIYPNHSCITANAFHAYYVLDAEGKVCDVWIPWRGW